MCGFAFAEREKAIEAFVLQSERGLDGVGVINGTGWKKWYEPKTNTFHTTIDDNRLKELYKNHLVTEYPTGDGFLLIHHRKGSQGSLGIDNVHPYQGKKFMLCQNGTDKKMRDWGTVEGFDIKWSDTYCLLQYLEQHCETLDDCLVRLNILNNIDIILGTIVVVHGTKALIYCDGERDLYIHTDKTDGKIRFSSEYQNKKFSSVGYAFFNLDGMLIKEEWDEMSVEKKTFSVVHNYTEHSVGYTGQNQYYHHYDYLDPTKRTETKTEPKKKKNQIMTNEQLWDLWQLIPIGGKIKVGFASVPRRVAAEKQANNVIFSRDALFVSRLNTDHFIIHSPSAFSMIGSINISKVTKERMKHMNIDSYDFDLNKAQIEIIEEIKTGVKQTSLLPTTGHVDGDPSYIDDDDPLSMNWDDIGVDETDIFEKCGYDEEDGYDLLESLGYTIEEIFSLSNAELTAILKDNKKKVGGCNVDHYYLNL